LPVKTYKAKVATATTVGTTEKTQRLTMPASLYFHSAASSSSRSRSSSSPSGGSQPYSFTIFMPARASDWSLMRRSLYSRTTFW